MSSDAPLSLREGGPSDLAAIHDLDRRLFPPEVAYDPATFLVHLMDPHAVTLIAEAGGIMAGFIIVEFEPPVASISTIDVDPAFQGRGVGALLMSAGEERARERECTVMSLEVAVGNDRARRFYSRCGYREVEPLPGFYADGEDGIRMEKPAGGGPAHGAGLSG